MDKKPIPFNYNGEKLFIYPGHLFTTRELISRLKEMKIDLDDSNYCREDIITIYEIAINYEINREKIIVKIKRDNQYMKLKEKLQNKKKEEHNNGNNKGIFHLLKEKIFFEGNLNTTKQNNDDDNHDDNENSITPDNSSINSSSSSWASYFCKKILKLLYKYKFTIIQKAAILLIILYIDNFLQNISDKYYLLGIIIRWFRSIFTKKRIIMFYLLLHVFLYILNSMFYLLSGVGIFGFLFFIFKDKIMDFFSNFLLNP